MAQCDLMALNNELIALMVCGVVIFLHVWSFVLNLFLLSQVVKLARRNLSFALTFLVCTTDLIFGLIVFVKYGLRILLGVDVHVENWWFCTYLGTCSSIVACTSSVLISMLALERYMCVCKGRSMPLYLTVALVTLTLLALLGMGVGTGVSDGYRMDPIGIFCIPSSKPWPVALTLMILTTLLLSLIVLIACYLGIYFFCRRLKEGSAMFISSRRMLVPIVFYCLSFFPVLAFIIIARTVGIHAVPKFIVILTPISAGTIPALNSGLVIFFNNRIRASLIEQLQISKITTEIIYST